MWGDIQPKKTAKLNHSIEEARDEVGAVMSSFVPGREWKHLWGDRGAK